LYFPTTQNAPLNVRFFYIYSKEYLLNKSTLKSKI